MIITQPYPFSEQFFSLWSRIATDHDKYLPFTSPRWHELWIKIFLHAPIEPYILSLEEKAIAPFVKNETSVFFSGGQDISDYMDIVCPDDLVHSVWEEILHFLKKDAIQELTLSNISEHSKTFEYFTNLQKLSSETIRIQKEDTTPVLALPATWNEYLSTLDRKNRHELRRKIKRFEETWNSNGISIQTTEDISILLDLMKKDPNKNAFLTDSVESFFNSLSSAFHAQFEVTTLFISDTPAASIAGFISENSYLLYNSGFDEAQYSGAGFYLKVKSIERAIEKNVKSYNFLQGNERYKYELGGKDLEIYTITVKISTH